MYKNQLQELAQRSCFNLPSYACIREGPDHAPRFKATVNFNGETFESPIFCSTLRQAEHAAAEVALNVLSRKGPSRVLAARVLDETGVYKNLLQETAHRAGLKLPAYTTVRSGPSHVPVFSCMVELAGMSFTGEPAKTKKQAQKNAAMTAWSALKKLSKSGPSHSSSSAAGPLSEFGGNDEQEQVTVARYLAMLQPPDTKKSEHRDCRLVRGSASAQRDVIPYGGGGSGRSLCSLQCQNWAYAQFSTELPMYHSWAQERAYQQQSHLLALAPVPGSLPRPQVFPFIQSIFQPDHGHHCLAEEQEPFSLVPGIGTYLYSSNCPMPVPVVRSVSQITIQEIEESPQVEKESLDGDGKSDCWNTSFPSDASRVSPMEIPNFLATSNPHSEERMQEILHNVRSATNTLNSIQLESNKVEQNDWTLPRHTDGRLIPRAMSTDVTKFRLQNPQSLSHLHSSVRPQIIPAVGCSGSVRGYVPAALAAPVTVRTASAVSTCSPRPDSSSPFMRSQPPSRNAVSACSRPWLGGMKNIRGVPAANSMAPAVHIRSVVPVCSASPARKTPGPSQEEPLAFSRGANKGTAKLRGEISAGSLEFDKLQI